MLNAQCTTVIYEAQQTSSHPNAITHPIIHSVYPHIMLSAAQQPDQEPLAAHP